jgi:hypothetical protein
LAANDKAAAEGLALAFAADDATDRKMESLRNASAIFEDEEKGRYFVGPFWIFDQWSYGVLLTHKGQCNVIGIHFGPFSNRDLAIKCLFDLANEKEWKRVE